MPSLARTEPRKRRRGKREEGRGKRETPQYSKQNAVARSGNGWEMDHVIVVTVTARFCTAHECHVTLAPKVSSIGTTDGPIKVTASQLLLHTESYSSSFSTPL